MLFGKGIQQAFGHERHAGGLKLGDSAPGQGHVLIVQSAQDDGMLILLDQKSGERPTIARLDGVVFKSFPYFRIRIHGGEEHRFEICAVLHGEVGSDLPALTKQLMAGATGVLKERPTIIRIPRPTADGGRQMLDFLFHFFGGGLAGHRPDLVQGRQQPGVAMLFQFPHHVQWHGVRIQAKSGLTTGDRGHGLHELPRPGRATGQQCLGHGQRFAAEDWIHLQHGFSDGWIIVILHGGKDRLFQTVILHCRQTGFDQSRHGVRNFDFTHDPEELKSLRPR